MLRLHIKQQAQNNHAPLFIVAGSCLIWRRGLMAFAPLRYLSARYPEAPAPQVPEPLPWGPSISGSPGSSARISESGLQ